MKMRLSLLLLLALALGLSACTGTMQRGMRGTTLVSTTRPALSMEAKGLPLLDAGEGTARLLGANTFGGLNIRVWLAVYGEAKAGAPVAVTALAETPRGWQWDHVQPLPGSVQQGMEVFNGIGYTACTYIVQGHADAFAAFNAQAEDTRWLVRQFVSLHDFRHNKSIMEYREPLPADITSLTALPLGFERFLPEFAQRARSALTVSPTPAGDSALSKGYAKAVHWQYMNERFLGTASAIDIDIME